MSNQNFIKFDTGAATKKVKEAVGELKQLDDILNEISHVSGLTGAQLKELGDSAFDAADKYGKSADKYLESVRKMYQAGQRNAAQMAELSLLAQTAGGHTGRFRRFTVRRENERIIIPHRAGSIRHKRIRNRNRTVAPGTVFRFAGHGQSGGHGRF